MIRLTTLIVAFLLFAAPARAQEVGGWLVGQWRGEGMGGQLSESWTAPAAGQLTGHFTLVKDGKLIFRQLLVLDTVDGVPRLRVRHFNADFSAWEEKDKPLDFTFESIDADSLVFKGLRFDRVDANTMTITIRFRTADGVGRDEILRYSRIP